ncbi:PP2C family protein-serine/threonine phosphatase [Homoserinibacter sp. YIM 151385]|uniref:PP2C family protein-serine/threonine phosphatase n=1 Tax=Homoserinibacter sp. YIM 151385 TaxID=2985506 RepID=UPI0022F0779A|nr:protein phosphatase 2C domain-containing protein [Homoserinibacter sp. YIM 151385]WBU39235.1 protein phosphatase 2C domain-containing protein [Homoserinibacter sp. YIM 151385]
MIEVDIQGATLRVASSSASSVGMVRAVNEDAFVDAHPVFAIADGMGGHSRGDRASREIALTLEELAAREDPIGPEDVIDAIRDANDRVRALAAADGPNVVSGSTLVGVALVTALGGHAYWMAFNIGDSRIYAWDGRRLEQLSVDHSVVQELVEAGHITEEEARRHPDRNVVTRAIGGTSTVDADVWMLPATESRAFLLCSDGLTKELEDEQIADILAGHGGSADDPTVAQALVGAAEAAGGSDNVTVVLLESVNREAAASDTVDRFSRTAERFEDTRPRV